MNAEEADEREPSGPHDYVMHILQIKHAKYEYELEENEIPEVIFYVLILDGSQLAKNEHLQQFAEQDETAVAEVDQWPDAPGLMRHRLQRRRQQTVLVDVISVEFLVRELLVRYVVQHFLSVNENNEKKRETKQAVVLESRYRYSVEKDNHLFFNFCFILLLFCFFFQSWNSLNIYESNLKQSESIMIQSFNFNQIEELLFFIW